MSPLLRWGIELRLWVALCVALLSEFCRLSLSMICKVPFPSSWEVVFFSTLALYNLDGSMDVAPDVENKGLRRGIHLALTLFSTLGLTTRLLELPRLVGLFVLVGFLLSATYAFPSLARGRRLKSLPGLKAPFVGTAVALAVVFVPALRAHALAESAGHLSDTAFPAGALCLCLAAFCTANAMLFDVPDAREDAARGVPTMVVRHGLAHTRKTCRVLCAVGSSAALLLLPKGDDVARTFFTSTLPLWTLGLALLLATGRVSKRTPKNWIAWCVDGSLILPFLVQHLATTA